MPVLLDGSSLFPFSNLSFPIEKEKKKGATEGKGDKQKAMAEEEWLLLLKE